MANNNIGGKVVAVTGGSRGIGLQWVKDLLKQGNTVIGTARDPSTAAAFKELSGQYPDKFVPTALEASSPDSITAWADGLKGKVSHIDVLVNNAGAAFEDFSMGIADITPKVLNDTFSLNTFGPILVTQALLQQGLLGGSSPSTVVYITSILGSIGTDSFVELRMYAYRASKSALNQLVVLSSRELPARNITSVLLHPGYVATDATKGHTGTISTEESVEGSLKVLQDGRDLNGKFYSYTGDELPW